ncbi:hypothetical protein NMY22_g10377 [Coprinellus aureogranulatus]|nr:hypothetical protein NMY22_g10377 [Coprinellus aureogranulatus]
MTSATPERDCETGLCKTFNLFGWKDESVWEHDGLESLPSQVHARKLMEVNFAQMKLTQSMMEWKDGTQNVATDGNDKRGEHDHHGAGSNQNSKSINLTRKEVVCHAVKTLLSEYCANEKGVEEAGTLFVDIDSLGLAADILEATEPVKWPARALAQMTLKVVQSIVLPYGLDDGTDNSSVAILFQHEGEVESYVHKIMKMCESGLAGKVEECLKPYFATTSEGGATTASTTDVRTASRLLSFCDTDDKETMTSVLRTLGSPRMPAAAIAQSVSKLVEENAPGFFKAIQEDLRKRYTFRSTPSVLQSAKSSGKATISVRSSPMPVPVSRSMTPPPRPFAVKQEDVEMADAEQGVPPSASAPSSPSKQTSPLPAPRANSIKMRYKNAPTFGSATQGISATFGPTTTTQGMSTTFGSTTQGMSASARTAPVQSGFLPLQGQSPSFRFDPHSLRDTLVFKDMFCRSNPSGPPQVEFAIVPEELNIGKGPEKFRWWNTQTSSFTSPQDIPLDGTPQPGDILTYWDTRRKQAGVYIYLAFGWTDITEDFFRNTGKIRHPAFGGKDSRVLTWRARDKRYPTYVKESTFKQSKQDYALQTKPSMQDFVQTEECVVGGKDSRSPFIKHPVEVNNVSKSGFRKSSGRVVVSSEDREDLRKGFSGSILKTSFPNLIEVLQPKLTRAGLIALNSMCKWLSSIHLTNPDVDCPSLGAFEEFYIVLGSQGFLKDVIVKGMVHYYIATFRDYLKPGGICVFQLETLRLAKNSCQLMLAVKDYEHSKRRALLCLQNVLTHLRKAYSELQVRATQSICLLDICLGRYSSVYDLPFRQCATGAEDDSLNSTSGDAEILKRNLPKVPPLNELLDDGYQKIEYRSDPHLIVDSRNRILAAVIPTPKELLDAGLNSAFYEAMRKTEAELDFMAALAVRSNILHWEAFEAISVGISGPCPLEGARNIPHTRQNAAALAGLLNSSPIHTIAGWQRRCCEMVMPQLYADSKKTLDLLSERKPSLSRPFPGTGFALATFDFGSPLDCFYDRRLPNDPGVCAITYGGAYDHRLGGHLVLKEVKTVIETPACSTILLPCSMFTYGNIPIADSETRVSMIQCSAGSCTHNVSGRRPLATNHHTPVVSTSRTGEIPYSHIATAVGNNEALWKRYQPLISTIDGISIN